MITKTLKSSFFIVAIASFSFASAQEKLEAKTDKSAKMFAHLDENADKIITLEEYKSKTMKHPSKEAQVEARFASIDTDENGTIDKAEYRAFFEGTAKPKLKMKKKEKEIKPTKG
jgi:Ca2+-binding EF-hand superfamily protein